MPTSLWQNGSEGHGSFGEDPYQLLGKGLEADHDQLVCCSRRHWSSHLSRYARRRALCLPATTGSAGRLQCLPLWLLQLFGHAGCLWCQASFCPHVEGWSRQSGAQRACPPLAVSVQAATVWCSSVVGCRVW